MMRVAPGLSLVALGLLAAGCGDGDTDGTPSDGGADRDAPTDHRATVPEAPAADVGLQFVQPEAVIEPGEERMICWIPDFVPDEDFMAVEFKGIQSPLGHHVLALRSAIPRQANSTFDCTDLESMSTMEPLLIPNPEDGTQLLPDGHAVRVKAGTKMVFQSHYVNYTDEPIVVSDVAQIFFAPDPDPVETGYFITNHGGLNLEAGTQQDAVIDCTVGEDLQLAVLFGHMHDLGRAIKIERTSGGVTDVLYDVPEWTVEFRDVPPLELYDTDAPLQLHAGDTLKVTCSYDNVRDHAVTFPEEMCSTIAYFYPVTDDALIICD